MTEYADDANSAIDELQGKLLDFDKFRSMSSPAESQQGLIDENLVNILAGYESYLDKATNEAHKLATEWLGLLGITKDQNGEWQNTGTVLDDIDNKKGRFPYEKEFASLGDCRFYRCGRCHILQFRHRNHPRAG
jgi:hypothetical protein